MMSSRVPQIIAAMKGRQAAAVNDGKLRDAVRLKLDQIAAIMKSPATKTSLVGCAAAVCRAASRTIIFEEEVLVAMEMGAAGELDVPNVINQSNCAAWVTAYAASGDRRAAQEHISLNAARDRKRIDAIAADESRRAFEDDGLRRAWQTFLEDGSWTFREGYGAALYAKIGVTAIRALLPSDRIAAARTAALASVRRDYPQKYRTAPEEEVAAADIFTMHYKAHLARTYFEELRTRGLSIDNAGAL